MPERCEEDLPVVGFKNGRKEPERGQHPEAGLSKKQILPISPAAIYQFFHSLLNTSLPSAYKQATISSIFI